MSVEQTSTSVGAKAVTAAEGRSGVGKGKASANQGAGDAAPGGFMALLATFDEPEAATSLPSDLTTEVPDGLAAPALLADKAVAAEVPWSELSMLLGQKMPLDTQPPTAAQMVVPDTTLPSALQVPVNIQVPSDGQMLAEASESALPGAPATLASPYQPAGKPLALPDPKASDPAKADHVSAKTALDSFLPDLTKQGETAPGRKTNGTQSLLSASSVAEARVLKPATFMDLVAKEPTLSGALLTSGLGGDVLNQAARAANKPISGVATAGLEGSFAQHALTPGSADVAGAAAGAALSPESAVAEQVTYWVSQGIQNAQLKLEGFGAEPVEVTISLNGQEAQIDFRTDQPEVRQMLEGALTQLKETLAREGLILSGVSVGASGQEGAGAQQDRRQRPNSRQATVTTQETGLSAGTQRASPVAGRALDVFV